MLSQVFTFSLLATTLLAADFHSPVHDFGAMLRRGDLSKRQGYYPSTKFCGRGKTCAEACGPTHLTCPSESGLDCYDPAAGESCCPDFSGNSCNTGYYCTSDGAGTTYCCPDGMDTVNCAAAYSLTVALIRETGSVPVATSETPATTSLIHVSPSDITSHPISFFPTASYTLPTVPTGNASYTTSAPPEFTGAARRIVAGGLAVIAGAVGLAGLF